MQNLYTGTATAVGGRNFTMPKALGGSGAHGANPEQLFVYNPPLRKIDADMYLVNL